MRVQAHLGMDMRCAWGLHTRRSDIIILKVHEVVHNDLCRKYNNENSDIVYVVMAVYTCTVILVLGFWFTIENHHSSH